MEKGRDTLEVDIPIANWELAENVELTPNMHFVIDLLHLIHIEDWTLYSLAFKVNTDVTLGVTLSASAEKTFIDKSFLLMTFVCGAIPCGPVLVTPEVDVYGVVKVDGKISFEATISYTRRVTTNFTYAAGQGQNTTISIPFSYCLTSGVPFNKCSKWILMPCTSSLATSRAVSIIIS